MNYRCGLTMLLGVALTGCETTRDDKITAMLGTMAAGESQISGAQLDRLIADAAAHPLGSEKHPVRAAGPDGQRNYLGRLRCANEARPTFERQGNAGFGIFGNFVDLYQVKCVDSTPEETIVWMDMYHAKHVESAPIPGFTIVPARAFDAP
jgi:hypothetical protein